MSQARTALITGITGQDGSKLEFAFSAEKLNAPVAPSLFVFQPPAGIPVVESDR